MTVSSPSWNDPHQPGGLTALAYAAGGSTVIALSGMLDGQGARTLEQRLLATLDAGQRHVVLDLHNLRSVEIEAIWVLWASVRETHRRGGSLTAAAVSPALLRPFEPLSHLGLQLQPTVRAAIAAEGTRDQS